MVEEKSVNDSIVLSDSEDDREVEKTEKKEQDSMDSDVYEVFFIKLRL
jgi:hypothetical protein